METQNNINNGLTPNQQPQPQKEEEKKKKNKFVAWWLGLNKWAKVGICAGTAAILATAITLPIVLSNKSNDGGTYILQSDGGSGYESEKFNIKANYKYTFKLTIKKTKAQSFCIHNPSGIESNQIKFKDAKLEGVQNNWAIDSDGVRFGGDPIETEGTVLSITITSLETANNVNAQVDKGGE